MHEGHQQSGCSHGTCHTWAGATGDLMETDSENTAGAGPEAEGSLLRLSRVAAVPRCSDEGFGM